MAISDRIQWTLDHWGHLWKAPVGAFLSGVIELGMTTFMDVLGKSYAKKLSPFLKTLEASTEIPPELKPILDEMLNPTGEAAAVLLGKVGDGLAYGAVNRLIAMLVNPISRAVASKLPTEAIGAELAIGWGLRHPDELKEVSRRLRDYGFNDQEQAIMWELAHVRFPSEVVGPVWMRDKAKWEKYWDDVRSLGISEDRIELLKESLYKMPTPQDIVTWLAREVFEPAMIQKYGLDDEWEGVDKSLFDKIGLRESNALNYWRAHWEHPQYGDVRKMLHRGQISEQDVYEWFRVVEIPPYWRKGLTELMWEVPGRVELRMMAQYGLVDKAYIMDILKKDGLGEQYRSVVADMMIVRGVRTDIQTRYTKGWIDSAGVQAEIDALQLDPKIAQRLYQWIVKNVKGDRTTAEKDLTAAEIVKGVKTGVIDWAYGVQALMAMGYDQDEANYKLAINVEVVEGLPSDELRIRIDTIRRLRRAGAISQSDELRELVQLGLDPALAQAYAENDELRLTAAAKASATPPGA